VKTSGLERVERVLKPSGTVPNGNKKHLSLERVGRVGLCGFFLCFSIPPGWYQDSARTDIERLTLTSRNLASQKCRFQRFLVV
jgi:hypothetical protein